MKLCKTSDLKGGEILAKAILTPEFQVLLSDGIALRPEYIEKIKELGVANVYIKEDEIKTREVVLLKSDIEDNFRNKVKNIIEKHTYSKNSELVELCKTADNIITNILQEEELVEKIFDIKERSSDIYEHSISICSLATLTALKLKLDRKSIHDLGVACLLHDIGLRYLTIDYIDQDINMLSGVELTEYKKHPVYGYSALQNEGWISELSKNIILYHHERMDGSGFPLKVKDIPYEAKIVNVCDAFDEMICGIGCCRQKVYKAVEFLKSFKGSRFDEKIVDAFLEFTAVFPSGSRLLLSDGSIGSVLHQNNGFPDRPVVQMIKDKDGSSVSEEKIVDLIKINHIFVEKVLE